MGIISITTAPFWWIGFVHGATRKSIGMPLSVLIPPHDLDAEAAVLSTVLLEPEEIDSATKKKLSYRAPGK